MNKHGFKTTVESVLPNHTLYVYCELSVSWNVQNPRANHAPFHLAGSGLKALEASRQVILLSDLSMWIDYDERSIVWLRQTCQCLGQCSWWLVTVHRSLEIKNKKVKFCLICYVFKFLYWLCDRCRIGALWNDSGVSVVLLFSHVLDLKSIWQFHHPFVRLLYVSEP